MFLRNRIKAYNPTKAGLLLVTICLIFRLMDIFVFELDLLLGEIILSKVIGALIVMVYILCNQNLDLKKYWLNHNQGVVVFYGIVITGVFLLLGYIVEYIIFFSKGLTVQIISVDPKTGTSGSILFGVWLILGNIVNCFMEEGLFRGLLIPLFKRKTTTNKAIVYQSILFALWHLPWAFRWYQLGIVDTSGIIYAVALNTLPMFFIGIVFGVMFDKSDSIWAPWLSHFIINSVLNLVHLNTNQIDPYMTIRMAVFQSIIFMTIPLWVKYVKIKEKALLIKD